MSSLNWGDLVKDAGDIGGGNFEPLPDGDYDLIVIEATAKYLKEGSIPFDGDSVDRENVRDIMMRDYGLVPLEELAHKVS